VNARRALPPRRSDSPADFGRVAVLFGGDTSERAVSIDSGRNVLEALCRSGVTADGVDGLPALIAGLGAQRFDRVFNIMHGGAGENGVVQGLLEGLGVPYTGTRVLGAALTLDKIRTKQVWIAAGLPTPRFARLPAGADAAESAAIAGRIGYPLVVKPSCEGSSVGVTRVFAADRLAAALALAARHAGELLVETLIEGGEYTVGVLGRTALPSIRIVPAGEYYDYHAKYVADDTQYLCPGLPPAEDAAMRALALAAFDAAGASGWGRVDLMRDASEADWLLEVNTTPGMTSHSLVPKAARAAGLDFDELVWRILETSLPAAGDPP
jgi:D-alanine-D-alanine ligase